MTTKKGATSEVSPTEGMVRTIKGFDKDLRCRGFQFEIGKPYEHSGPVEICRSGFHGIDGNPLRVFEFYQPARSRYTLAEQSGQIKREHGKIVSAKITIGAEITLSDLIVRAVDWVIARVKGAKDRYAEGEKSLAWSNGAGSSSASNGYRSSSASKGAGSVAMSAGEEGRAKGEDGNAIFLVYRNPETKLIEHAKAFIVGRDGIKPDTVYMLDAGGSAAVASE